MNDTTSTPVNDARKVFWKCGTCSRTFFHLLNREFDHLSELEESAADPLAGGILQYGHQCGMLWGSAMAVGAEAFRRCKDRDQAVGKAMAATQELVASFTDRTHSVDCGDITGTDFYKPLQFIRYLLFRAKGCFKLAEDWAPEAYAAARKGLAYKPSDDFVPKSCASEVAQKMGANDEQIVTVAGLAGGLGFSGSACGALGAAIWLRSMEWAKEHPGKSPYGNPKAKAVYKKFTEATGGEVACPKLSGHVFHSLKEHSKFVGQGGCRTVFSILAED